MRLNIATLVLAAVLGAATAFPARADPSEDAAPRERPDLVLAISVDQLSADLFAQYRQHFTGGLARLLRGAVFASGYQSHAATETCPGHSTLLTGARPARNGIVANWWYDVSLPREDKRVYCAEDVSDPESTSGNPVVSAMRLKVPTIGDRLKAADPRSRNIAVSAKDRAVMMMGGHDIDAAYWWGGSGFVTLKGREPGAGAKAQNAELARAIAAGKPDMTVPEWCAPRDREVKISDDFSVGTYRFAVPPDQPALFGRLPYVDMATGELAVRLVDEYGLGGGDAPDMLSVSFSATDYVGHAFGHQGVEMCLQLAQLDETIGNLFQALDARGIDYVAVLSADHGGIDAPERLRQQADPQAARASADLSTRALAEAVSRETGVKPSSGPLLFGSGGSGDLYVTDRITAKDKQRVVAALVRLLRGNPQVEAVFTADEVAGTPIPSGSPQDWTLRQRVRANFNPEISGDVVVLLKRSVVPVASMRGLVATHGSPWDYDRRVPILFWRKGLPGLEQPAPVETVDIAPTLAAILRLDVPEGAFDGRCLDIDGGAADICAE